MALVLPSAVALALLGGAAFATWKVGVKGDLLRIRELRFSGLSQVTAAELTGLSPVRPGDHLLLSDLDGMARALRRNPWVASVEIRRRLPPALEVAVTERRAAALVDLGGLYLVDPGGQVFKRAAPGDGLDLPVVTGLTREEHAERRDEVTAILQAALALLDRWREAGLDRRVPVSEIHVGADLGVTVYAGEEGTEIRLGQGDLPAKLDRLGRVLSALEADGRRAEVLHLDNRRHPDWVAVRPAGRSGAVDGRGPRGP
ncbi:MAG TPA: FtsQ-type POTRA domain-containing protein [Anaeromyxobacteraceae bacterium]|nr:FtsQ-type POTRA domain-containing protein [Anaeromyxobacteraceae bacterium]